MIRAIGVVVPARDEEDDITACLTSVRASLGRLRGVATAVTVVLDRCVDRTPQRVDALFAGWPGAVALRVVTAGGRHVPSTGGGPGPAHIVAGSGVGALRDLGVRDVVGRLPARPESVWLLHTDADTVVPPDWALAQLGYAAAGAAGVAGTADLAESTLLSAPATRRYEAIVCGDVDGDRHRHVYGANLGVRADAYLTVGGFPVDGSGEDHGLWARLVEAGYRLEQPTQLRVRTSARLCGRASGGLADLLAGLQDTSPAG